MIMFIVFGKQNPTFRGRVTNCNENTKEIHYRGNTSYTNRKRDTSFRKQ